MLKPYMLISARWTVVHFYSLCYRVIDSESQGCSSPRKIGRRHFFSFVLLFPDKKNWDLMTKLRRIASGDRPITIERSKRRGQLETRGSFLSALTTQMHYSDRLRLRWFAWRWQEIRREEGLSGNVLNKTLIGHFWSCSHLRAHGNIWKSI